MVEKFKALMLLELHILSKVTQAPANYPRPLALVAVLPLQAHVSRLLTFHAVARLLLPHACSAWRQARVFPADMYSDPLRASSRQLAF